VLGEVKDETGTDAALNYDSGQGALISARTAARSTGASRFHTDKCDLLSLLCASNVIEGGISKVATSVTIHNEMARRHPDLLREIGEEVCLFAPFEPGDMRFLIQHVTDHGRTPFRNDPAVGASCVLS
jgi:hypothetical protein